MIRRLAKLVFGLWFRVELRGEIPKRIPERLVVIANHQSLLDGALLFAFLPFESTWVVHTQIWEKWYFRAVLSVVRSVVVDTTRPQAIRSLVKVIEKGEPVAIFPEGRATVTGSLMKIYDGPAFLAAKTGAEVLPVSIDGSVYTVFSRAKHPFPKKLCPKITLTLFPMRPVTMPEARTGRLRRQKASREMRRLLEQIRFASRERTTLHEALLDAVRLYGRSAIVLDDVRREGQTYGDLLKATLALGRLSTRLGDEGEALGVLLPNSGVTVGLLFGMFANRRLPAMINYGTGVEGMQVACTAARIRTVITSREFLDRARLTDKVAQLRDVRLVYLEDLRAQFGLIDKLWLIGWALRFPRLTIKPSRPEDQAIVLFPSGSEGKPKGVVLSHDALLANVAQMRSVIEFSNKDRFLMSLPMFHSFGLTVGVVVGLLSGCRIFLYPSPLHYRLIPELTYDRDCTALFGTPAFLAAYGKVANPYDFYNVRYVIAGADKLTDEVRQLWHEKFGIRIIEGYGATECAPVLAANTPFAYKAGTVGNFLPGIEHKVLPVEGIENGGALHVRGANLMLGYLRDSRPGVLEPPSSEAGPGWYDTGDVVEIDDDGFVRITARLKRFAKVAGEMVSLEVAERIAREASPDRLSAATALPQSGRGEVIVLFTENNALRREHLVAAARTLGLPDLAIARRIEYVRKLPLLGSGKCDYLKLRAMAEELT